MRLSQEAQYLIQKRLHHALQPAEIGACAVLATFFFAVTSGCLCFEMRYHNSDQVLVIIACLVWASIANTWVAYLKYQNQRPSRAWIGTSVGMWSGLAIGYLIGDRYWYAHTLGFYTYHDMANYVNVDPETDVGKGFMDAGIVYFKEGSHVLTEKALSFHNGASYCIAPIVRKPLTNKNGFEAPASGTVDFWAVGTDCCGENGEEFTCGDAASGLARSGLRSLDTTSRSMYLLAVQEWSASTQLPVKHPLFFHFVKDPLARIDHIDQKASSDYWMHLTMFSTMSLIGSFLLHMGLQKIRIA